MKPGAVDARVVRFRFQVVDSSPAAEAKPRNAEGVYRPGGWAFTWSKAPLATNHGSGQTASTSSLSTKLPVCQSQKDVGLPPT